MRVELAVALGLVFGACGRSDVEFAVVVDAAVDSTPDVARCIGTWGFAPAVTYATDTLPTSIAAGDFNGDGHLDLVVALSYYPTIGVMFGEGNGAFHSLVSQSAGTSYHDVAAGDFNGDGALDIALADGYDNSVSVMLNGGRGCSAPPSRTTPGTCCTSSRSAISTATAPHT